MLASDSRPTKPAAAAAVIRAGNISWLMAEAWPRTPIPAVTFMQSTIQSSQNCGVRNAVPTSTWEEVTSVFAPAASGTYP